MSLFKFYRYLVLEEKVVSTSRTLGDWIWLCSPTALAWVPFPSLMPTYSGVFFLGSFCLSPSAKNQYSKLKFDVEKWTGIAIFYIIEHKITKLIVLFIPLRMIVIIF